MEKSKIGVGSIINDIPSIEVSVEATEAPEEVFQVYARRWTHLAIFCLLNLANALMWVTFAPISDLAQSYFGDRSVTDINSLAVVFLIVFPFGTILEVLSMKSYGLRKTLILGGTLTAIGAFLRFVVAQCNKTTSINGSTLYAIIMIGQLFAALAQPLLVNMPAHMSAAWFPTSERDTSTTIGSMFSPIGNAVGQLLPVLLVSRAASGQVEGMAELMLTEFIICAVALIFAVLYFTDSPPTPPSRSTLQKHSHSTTSTPTTAWSEIRQLACDRNYRILWTSFSCGVAIFNSLLTLVNQLVRPYGYSNEIASAAGVALIVAGLVGAGLVSVVLERTRAYNTVVKGGFLLCLLSMMLLVCMLRPNNTVGLFVSFAITGLVLLPMLPASFEACAETTYPLSVDLSVGLLLMGGNLFGIPITYILESLIEDAPWGPPPFTPSACFMVAVVLFASMLLFFFKGDYKRLACDRLPSDSRGEMDCPLLS